MIDNVEGFYLKPKFSTTTKINPERGEYITEKQPFGSIILRQIPFLLGGTITGIIMTYYFGFLFSIIVNSAIWYVISAITYKLLWKSNGARDQKYLFDYATRKLKSR